jgi:hypothetical protein
VGVVKRPVENRMLKVNEMVGNCRWLEAKLTFGGFWARPQVQKIVKGCCGAVDVLVFGEVLGFLRFFRKVTGEVYAVFFLLLDILVDIELV